MNCPNCNSKKFWDEDTYVFCPDCGYLVSDKSNFTNPYCVLRIMEKRNTTTSWQPFNNPDELFRYISKLNFRDYDELIISRFDGKKIMVQNTRKYLLYKKLNRL